MSDLDRLYQDLIRKHADAPCGFKAVIDATHRYEEYNPLCGDRVEIHFRVVGERIEAAAFSGEACAICLASSSLLCRHLPGQAIWQVEESRQFLLALLESADPPAESDVPEFLLPLSGVRPYPSRIRCATLPWSAACKALDSGKKDH